jgi:hypothetical protein
MPVKVADCKVQSYESETAKLQCRVPVRVLQALEAEQGDMLRWFTDGEDIFVRVQSHKRTD